MHKISSYLQGMPNPARNVL